MYTLHRSWCVSIGFSVFAMLGAAELWGETPAQTGMAPAQTSQSPLIWPQSFTLSGPIMRTFGVPVTQPGPIEVDLQVNGAPVVATLQGHAGELTRQQGAGSLHMSYVASASDIQESPIIVLTATLAAPQLPPAATTSVTVTVRHPPIDAARLKAAMEGFKAKTQATVEQRKAAAAQSAALVNTQREQQRRREQADLEQRRQLDRAALIASIQPQVERLKSQTQMQSRALPGANMKILAPLGPPAITGLVVGTTAVTQLHVGDPVFVNGTGFGAAPGVLHFVIGAGQDLPADPKAGLVWSDKQIYAVVPGPAQGGLPAYNGVVYVQRTADSTQSNALPFGFVPQIEYRTIQIPPHTSDAIFGGSGLIFMNDGSFADGIFRGSNGLCFSGASGTDQILVNTHLKPGWTVRGPPTLITAYSADGGGGAVAIPVSPFSNYPAVNVYWWLNVGVLCLSWYSYGLDIPIQGALGTPDGIVVP
jgi:hypothetical protein